MPSTAPATMNTIELKARYSDRILYTHTAEGATLREAILAAIAGGANLASADLRGAALTGATLTDATLTGADLGGADLRHLLAVPGLDELILAQVEAQPDALEMDAWHTCETTHCRAGWAITLAGAAGRTAEALLGPATAGALIYAASYPELPVPNFGASNEDALADIRLRATLSA